MASNLAPSKLELIYDMIHSGELSITDMAKAAGCNKSTISANNHATISPIPRIQSWDMDDAGYSMIDRIHTNERPGLQLSAYIAIWTAVRAMPGL
ncbi:hypothetical protein N7540_004281 [Penicillium herquei]|nr:hypothetical protein N7540_004281 [Penicillium herquei]